MRISICPIVAALTGGNIGQLADASPAGADRGRRPTPTPTHTLLICSAAALLAEPPSRSVAYGGNRHAVDASVPASTAILGRLDGNHMS
jgi:hypothetical protein